MEWCINVIIKLPVNVNALYESNDAFDLFLLTSVTNVVDGGEKCKMTFLR